MFKKTMLLASMALAVVAFAAPAMAQAYDEWYTHVGEEEVTIGNTTETGDLVEFTGSLSSKTTTNVINGPCVVHAQVLLWNEIVAPEDATATGEVTGFQITGPCDVTVPGSGTLPTAFCSVSATASVNTENPWHVNVGPNTEISIEGANFTNHYTAGCQSIGFPAEAEASGTATGQGTAGGCIVFNESGDFTEGVTISGEVCAPGLTLH
jgi:hypothetical protein